MDFIAIPLGKFMLFIYNTIAFHNYGLAIIIFTIIVKLALLPLTLKQLKSSSKMQELQPIIADIQKRYKDDKDKMNQEMMKVYQEHHYNPAGGCLPLLIQMPILITLYWVIIQPLKFMIGITSDEVRNKIIEVAARGMSLTVQAMGHGEIRAMNYFFDHRDALSQVSGLLKESDLINFNNFLGLHLGETATYNLQTLFGPEAKIYIPLLILAIAATATTYISTKLSMPKKSNSGPQQNAAGSSMTNSMMYIGPVMTLVFSFSMPAGIILYWMIGYVVSIFQQLYINKFVMNKDKKEDSKNIAVNKKQGAGNSTGSGSEAAGEGTALGNGGNTDTKQLNAGGGTKQNNPQKGGQGAGKGGNKGGGKKKGAK